MAAAEQRDGGLLATSLANAGGLYLALGRGTDAEPLYRRALLLREGVHGKEHLAVAETLHGLAEARRIQGAHADAEPLYWRAVMIRSWLQGGAHQALWPTLKGLAEVNRALGREPEARELYARASAIAEKSIPASLGRARLSDFSVGDSEAAAEARGSSVSLLLMPGTSLGERKRLQASEHPELARHLEGLAEIYRAQGRLVEAIDALRRSLAIREKSLGPRHPEVAHAYRVMERLLADQRAGPVPASRSGPDPARR